MPDQEADSAEDVAPLASFVIDFSSDPDRASTCRSVQLMKGGVSDTAIVYCGLSRPVLPHLGQS